MGIVEHGARKRDHIGLAVGDDRFGLLGGGDQPDRPGGDAGLTLHLLGELDIGVGDQGGSGFGADAAGGDAHEIEPDLLQRPGECNRIVRA